MFYKVVRSQGMVKESVVPPSHVYSHITSNQHLALSRNPWCLQYELNIPTTPNFPESKLFVFNDLDCAVSWTKTLRADLSDYIAHLIYECQVENPVVAHCRSVNTDDLDLVAFWTVNNAFKKVPLWQTTVPEGTCWVDSVTLTKLVKVHDPAA